MTPVSLISYSLYLWHWPIITFIHYIGLAIDEKMGLFIFFMSFILSFISWRFIEEPFRKKYKFGFKASILLFMLIPTLLAGVLVVVCQSIPQFGFNKVLPSIIPLYENHQNPPLNAVRKIDSTNIEASFTGDLSKKAASILVIGDSHAMAYAGMLNVFFKERHLKAEVITQAGSPFILGHFKGSLANNPMGTLGSKMVKDNHYDFVVLGGYWNYYPDSVLKNINASPERYSLLEQGLNKALRTILFAGSTPVLMLDVPPLRLIPIACGFTRLALTRCDNAEAAMRQIQAKTRAVVLRLAKKYPSVRVIDPYPDMCQNGRCFSALNDTPLYYTNGANSHLTHAGSTLIGEHYLQRVGNPFALARLNLPLLPARPGTK